MYVSHGCFGVFVCNGAEIRCGSHEWPPVTNCTCMEAVFRDGQRQYMPEALSAKRLSPNDDVRKPRFVPQTQNETFDAIFTWWNILDAMMRVHEPKHRFANGYVREMQLRRMYELVRTPKPAKTYCEIGFNGGHSAVAMLLSSPHLKVHVFDLMMWGYSRPIADLLRSRFRERFEIHAGDSKTTVPSFAANHSSRRRGRCNLVFVDGSHERHAVLTDLQNVHWVTARGARVLVDDIGRQPGCDVSDAQDEGARTPVAE